MKRWPISLGLTFLLCQPYPSCLALISPSAITTKQHGDTVAIAQCLQTQEQIQDMTRKCFFQAIIVASMVASPAFAFDGGVGGLGKTKPTTGVILFEENSTPIRNEKGIVSAEIRSASGKPILVQFQTPWPLLPTSSGLEARDLRSSESAFIQLVPTIPDWQNRKNFQRLLLNSVLASQGKFGAYGTPTDIRVKPYDSDRGIYSVSFTSYTPAMRESERQIWVKPIQVGDSLVMLVAGTTKNTFSSQERVFSKVLDSFLAVAAPESGFRASK